MQASEVRSLLRRVQRLEQARQAPRSPFALDYGSFEAFEAQCRAEMAAGKLARDFPIECLARWERTDVWATAQRRR